MNSAKKKVAILFLFIVVLIAAFLCFRNVLGYLGEGYQYIGGRTDNLHIRKEGKIIVQPTIVDFDTSRSHVVGLRLPAKHLECDDGGYRIRIYNNKEYFILSLKTGRFLTFLSRKEFEEELNKLEILDRVSLNYDNFSAIWQQYSRYYKNIDYTTCKPLFQG